MQYQLGAQSIWWILDRFISGNMHNPKDVFEASRDSFSKGKQPLLSFTETYWFGGVKHTVEPVAWDDTTRPWTITIHDYNLGSALKTITVDPDENWFPFPFSSAHVLSGGRWSRSKMFYWDLDIVGGSPRVPTWDLLAIIVIGIIIICAGDTTTTTMTDVDWNDIDGTLDEATTRLQQGEKLDGYFMPFPKSDALGLSGTLRLLRREWRLDRCSCQEKCESR